jgi:hypothetical protein
VKVNRINKYMDISVHLLNVINIILEVDHLRFESDKRQEKEVYDEPQYSTERQPAEYSNEAKF